MHIRKYVFPLLIWTAFSAWGACADPSLAARWDFNAEESTPLQSHGGVHRDVPGPRSTMYPDFDSSNTAIRLDGQGAHLSLEDPGTQSPFDFTNGDAITLEAWVLVEEIRPGEFVYVVGKGRTAIPGFAADNQNWALRIRETGGKVGISFLFATEQKPDIKTPDAHWHRWSTKEGFTPGENWHHISITYRFGEADSIRGWIDGKPQAGSWDMGGATAEAPVIDNDAIWIGSSRGGAAGNSFRGSLDAVAVHREVLSDSLLQRRFRREGAEVVEKPAHEIMPESPQLLPGQALLSLREGMPSHSRWLNQGESLPALAMSFPIDSFLIDRLPQRHDAWGIRDRWKGPVLMQMATAAQLSPGKHRFLMRVRGLSRLWVNGKVIARGKPLGSSPSGEESITPVAEPPLPGLRIAEHRQQEISGDAEIGADGHCRIVLETIVGTRDLRTDPGEQCVAVQTDDAKMFVLVSARGTDAQVVPLTDVDVTAALARLEASLIAFDDINRRKLAASQDSFWNMRHGYAKSWAAVKPAPPIPKPLAGTPPENPIDAFLTEKIERAVADSSKSPPEVAKQFHGAVLPILRDHCFRCHGDKATGGLSLNSREAALRGGDSATPSVVPGDASASELIRRIHSTNPDDRMPPGESALPAEQIATLEAWVKDGAAWPAKRVAPEDTQMPPVVSDTEYLRRIYLDTVGVPPTETDVRAFQADSAADKRTRVIDRLLADERWADHWMSYWQDVLAENPTLLNPSLNTTGPFRWFLYDALRDNKPLDRIVTELIQLRGDPHEGGSAGFGIAADNDAPFAAKGQIVANAFLGIELQCARCHDSPYHSTKQSDLYALAAMLEQKSVTVPRTSRVPAAFFEAKARESLIKVTLKPDEQLAATWPFADVTGCADDASLAVLMQTPSSTRDRLAALVTSPKNGRFSQVIVNRVWRRFIGAGIVEPPHDWEGREPSHPELLKWLAHDFVAHDYDLKHLSRRILTSQLYQRAPFGKNVVEDSNQRFFVAPQRRRLTAEQIVDSLFVAAGQSMDVEEITFDPDGRRASSNRLTLGIPRRAWMFASLANERDRPSLSLPKARAIADVMEAFGWTGSRQNPRTDRESDPNVLQPGVLANSTASVLLTRASQGSGLAEVAVTATSPEQLVDSLFMRYLGRAALDSERAPLANTLAVGFAERLASPQNAATTSPNEPPSQRLPVVTWSNHLRPEATTIAMELERRARIGAPADDRLRAEWREVYEDVIWSIINLREFVWVP